MYLKSIELQGFKSFPDKTTLSFNEGITVIIGPNGSGKSNIADAMRWVLGEVSSRNIRGTKMEDVIFGGCESRKPGSFAQVTLCLDNSSPVGRLNIDYDTVTVTRRYFKGGTSDYLINGKACRLKDIHKLFMNTGIGREGYSVIGQGKIAEIVSRKSEERRSVFEEAAGISKYKFSKNESAKKLEQTEDNLSRVLDILGELEGRVGPLEKEAEKAKKYLVLAEEKKSLDIAVWLYDMTLLAEEIKKFRGTYELYKTELELTDGELSALEAKTESLMAESIELKRAQEAENKLLSDKTEEKFRKSNAKSMALKEIEHLKSDILTAEETIKALGDEFSELSTKIKEKLDISNALAKTAEELRTQHTDAVTSHTKITESLEKMSLLADDIIERSEKLKEKMTDIRIKLSVADTGDGEDVVKDTALDEEISQRQENLKLIESRAEKAEDEIKKYDEKFTSAVTRADEAKKEAENAEKEAAKLREQINEIYIDISSKTHRIENLKRMEELLEGYSHSVRFIVEEYKKGNIRTRDGGVCGEIYGPVSRLIKVGNAYATAIETALGASMQNIVCKDDASAKDAIRHLQKHGAGRATFYPVSTIKPMYLSYNENELSKNDGYIGVASSLVSSDEKFKGIIGNLLGRTVVFENMDKASVFAKKYDHKIRIVTLDGQLINAGGSYTGGSARNDSGMLSRNTQIDTLTKQINDGKGKMEALKKQLAEATESIKALEAAAADANEKASIINTLLNAENTQLQILKTQISKDFDRLEELKAEKNDIGKRAERRKLEKEALENELASLQKQLEELAVSLENTENDIKNGNVKQEELRTQIASLDIKIAENAKEKEAADTAGAELTERINDVRERKQTAEGRLSSFKNKFEENIRTAEDSSSTADALEDEITAIKARIESLSVQSLSVEGALNSSRAAEKEKAHKKELMFREFTTAENKLNSSEEKREKLTQSLKEEYDLTYSEAKEKTSDITVTPQTRGEHVKRQTELKNKLRALGHVNVNAAEEYKEVKERYDFMTAQTEDLKAAKTELEEIIYKLDEEMKSSFSEAIEEINVCFGRVFTHLFGGGHAEIKIAEPDNILESGIDINVAPPGKIVKSLSLLSGGEQSFVAIALYFALLEVNPTPFILLDEIEAALDEVNVDRFADYLTVNKAKTQFILISHRRGTMEAADRLYGVTMPTKGISKILSVDIGEIEQKIGKLD